ncbi:hypothetical protein DITRI_Ditri08aG0069700 [Diplodiscus trichospermus]
MAFGGVICQQGVSVSHPTQCWIATRDKAELLAICFGPQLAEDHGATSMIVESDSKVAVGEIQKQGKSMCAW